MTIKKAHDGIQWRYWMKKATLAEVAKIDLEDVIDIMEGEIEYLENKDYKAMGEWWANNEAFFKSKDEEAKAELNSRLEAKRRLLEQLEEVSDEAYLDGEALEKNEIVVITFTYPSGLTV